ncbi:hypothetical protein [Tropicibacter naphthalenivorans]|uniref:Uncharacterized protein n=1 Tax=Tropicibacter naphthalenivorans TaxID=441103 RepID=A0A0P1GG81_9RHOB|nr:hypothetical protein [Tropicibacter naphthalenivorans]CUH80894.1 hypothetical protein TRN7648_03219 [Tropicibacter naphthalenivorans]SMC90872.1 hypothetical protein SAMN04488093_106191 [Tropicibacter naphthalenivorans]
MISFLELIKLLAMLVLFGALVRAGYGAVSVSPEFGDGTLNAGPQVRPALIWAGCALGVFVLSGLLQKRIK